MLKKTVFVLLGLNLLTSASKPVIEDDVIAFAKCLTAHRNSSDLGGIPKACEDQALTLRLLGHDSKVNEMIARFTEVMKAYEVMAFAKCLVDHMDSSHIAVSGIPKDCESHALRLRLSGCKKKVDEMIARFKTMMNEECPK